MQITNQLLQYYEADEVVIQKFNRFFGEQAELSDIINYEPIQYDLIYFILDFIKLPAETTQIIAERLRVIDSVAWFDSHNLNNCVNISNSEDIIDSKYVRYAHQVDSSSNVHSSSKITASHDILNSSNISNSSNVIDSTDISYSTDIIGSNEIDWSRIVLNSSRLEESGYIYNSHELFDCWFCGFLTNCDHCLMCSNIVDTSYAIFNQPVDAVQFEDAKQQLLYWLQNESKEFVLTDTIDEYTYQFNYNLRLDSVFNGLSQDFYGKIGQLPNFDEQIFLQLFFTDYTLK